LKVDVPVFVAVLLARPVVLFELDFEAAVLRLDALVRVVGASLGCDGSSMIAVTGLVDFDSWCVCSCRLERKYQNASRWPF
jgi:hypothetical protein